ncbi:hypothetical protein PUNSTDRAFT_122732 [Punctularia strigosozonata HHB-11173 SS5]|uniref:Uncharacterized protein n=1 Tax=Punctularia strigosozonata (strain HHB-11173) TaxID=741275 RepID=R7S4G8_PUNST|nr:uncharacterized protein PUNSTDRAFT_122732 [Punctularia strigosozonata HHB-11173 SS5]EIN04697.1 hypothetical protein PUNSTDRAFT_122732 [Punctularia strigosozonata HHB-11173 SS5]
MYTTSRKDAHWPNEEQEIIDKEIKMALEQIESLRNRVRSLRERRNSLAPVNRLPPEVLTSVFQLCVLNATPSRCGHAFVAVSRRWREVALGAAILWTLLPRSTTELTELFISRSQHAPLEIDIGDYTTDWTNSGASALSAVMNRVQTLSYSIFEEDVKPDVHALSLPTPLLIDCSVKNFVRYPLNLPENFLGSFAPRLRRLRLYQTSFQWSMLHYPSLVSGLVDLQVHVDGDSFPLANELTTALRLMPSLRRLVIISVQESGGFPTTTTTSGEVAEMNNLELFKLYGPARNVCDILDHLIVPPRATLVLRLEGEDEDWDVGPLLRFLERHCTYQSGGPDIRGLMYRRVTWLPWDFAACAKPNPSHESVQSLLILGLTHPRLDASHVLQHLRLDRLETVEVKKKTRASDVDAAGSVARFLEHCGHATDLEIGELGFCTQVVPLLAPSAGSVLVPRLQRLMLDLDSHDRPVELVAALREVLTKRYERLGVMPELIFVNFSGFKDAIPPAVLEELGQITTIRVVGR